jgi:hypothetical protein
MSPDPEIAGARPSWQADVVRKGVDEALTDFGELSRTGESAGRVLSGVRIHPHASNDIPILARNWMALS